MLLAVLSTDSVKEADELVRLMELAMALPSVSLLPWLTGAAMSEPSTWASLFPSESFLPQVAKWAEPPFSSGALAVELGLELRSRKMPMAAAQTVTMI